MKKRWIVLCATVLGLTSLAGAVNYHGTHSGPFSYYRLKHPNLSTAEIATLGSEEINDFFTTRQNNLSAKPLLSACNGVAVGVGATMQLAMDMRLASDTARYGFVFARRGIVPEACSSWFLPRLVGIQQAMEWCMTGRIFDAGEAKAGGLVRSVHPQAELMEATRALAREIAENTSAVSVAMTRAMLWRLSATEHPMMAHRIDSRAIYRLSKGADAKEGVQSFLEKRPPAFPAKVSTDMPDFYPWWEEPPFL